MWEGIKGCEVYEEEICLARKRFHIYLERTGKEKNFSLLRFLRS